MKQGHREKLSVTVDPRLYQVVERYAERTKVPKSRIIEEAIRLWERSHVAALAREGYQKTKEGDLRDAEAYLPALDEIEEE
jgi:predicted transcriptional regulator